MRGTDFNRFKRTRVHWGTAVSIALLLVLFQNCSDVGFEKQATKSSSSPAVTPPRIVQHPSGFGAVIGSPFALAVVAEGSAPLTYQWYKNGSPVTAPSLAVLTFANLQAPDAGLYFVTVSNSAGEATSNSTPVLIDQQLL